jgi:ArsR family transcriptional regulator
MECQISGLMHITGPESSSADEQREHLAVMLKALGHPARLHIIQFLSTVTTCFCGDIVQQLPLAQSTVSQHLKILKEAGLVQGEIDGPRTCYWLDRNALAIVKSQVALLP